MTIPNYITLFRILLVPFFFTCLVSIETGQDHYRIIALILFTIASITDALDGIIARATNKQTNLGEFLDPLADKLLLISGYLGLLFVRDLLYFPPLWVTVTIVFRDMTLVIGLIVVYLVSGSLTIKPNLLGKSTTLFQMLALILILLQWKIATLFWTAAVFLTVCSCIAYVSRGIKLMNSGDSA